MNSRTSSSLAGKRVVVTRAPEQSESLCRELETRGAIPILFPLISFAPSDDFASLDAALCDPSRFDWLFLTSQNVLRALLDRCASLKISFPLVTKNLRIAAVGPATANAATDAGLVVAHVASNHHGVALVEELQAELLGCRIFLPRSDRANLELPEALQRIGAEVTQVIAYRTVRPGDPAPAIVASISEGRIDAVLFFSPSAVQHFRDLLGESVLRVLRERAVVVAIGPVTARALRDAGMERVLSARDTTVAAIVSALEEHFAGTKPPLAGAKRG